MEQDDDAVRAVVACLREAIRQKDIPVALSLMTDDVIMAGAVGPPVAGLEAVRAALSSELPWKYDVTSTHAEIAVEVLENIAIVTGNHADTLTPEHRTLPTVRMQGRSILVCRRQVDGWKLARWLILPTTVSTSDAPSA